MRFKTVSVIRFGIPILVVWLACFPAIVLGCLEDLKVNGLPRVEKKTNVVVIMGDDWSWPHASVLGHSVVQTPVFDRIAREGVLFESAFTNAPSCTPSRLCS